MNPALFIFIDGTVVEVGEMDDALPYTLQTAEGMVGPLPGSYWKEFFKADHDTCKKP